MEKWQHQLLRAERYFERFKKLNAGVKGPMHQEYADDIHSFFIHCYHVKDYLINDAAYTKHNPQQINAYVRDTPALSMCRDLANARKHCCLDRGPRNGWFVSDLIEELVCIGTSDSGPVDSRTCAVKMQIVGFGQTRDAFEVATEAVQAWRSFTA